MSTNGISATHRDQRRLYVGPIVRGPIPVLREACFRQLQRGRALGIGQTDGRTASPIDDALAVAEFRLLVAIDYDGDRAKGIGTSNCHRGK
jgi:hypothetical protein